MNLKFKKKLWVIKLINKKYVNNPFIRIYSDGRLTLLVILTTAAGLAVVLLLFILLRLADDEIFFF